MWLQGGCVDLKLQSRKLGGIRQVEYFSSLQGFWPNFRHSPIFERLSPSSIYIPNMIKRHYKREIGFSLIPFLHLTEEEKKQTLRRPDKRMTQIFQTSVRNRKLDMGVSCSCIWFNPTVSMEILNKVGVEFYYFFSLAHVRSLIHATQRRPPIHSFSTFRTMHARHFILIAY